VALTEEQIVKALDRAANDDSIAKVSVKVYYTDEYEKNTPSRDVEGTIENIIETTNQVIFFFPFFLAIENATSLKGYRNTDIKIELFSHCPEKYAGKEVYDGVTMLNQFTASKGWPNAPNEHFKESFLAP